MGVVSEVRRDMHGRYIMIKVQICEDQYCIVNVYGPNKEGGNTEFYKEMQKEISTIEYDYLIIGGDFNTTIDMKVDRSSDTENNQWARNEVKTLINTEELVDIWRARNPEVKKFTWHRGKTWSRIDYFLISQCLANWEIQSDIKPSIQTDHSLIVLELETTERKRGPGVWKFNDQLLDNEEYVSQGTELILNLVKQYSYLNAIDHWELIKHEIIRFSQEFSRQLRYERKDKKFKLSKLLEEMQTYYISKPEDKDTNENMPRVQAELDAYYEEEAKSSAFRARARYDRDGEKSSRYFFGLEKCNYVTKTMYQVKTKSGKLTKDYTEILNVQEEFYSELYTSNNDIRYNISNKTNIKLSEGQRDRMGRELEQDEIFDAIMTLKTGKVPGGDGLSLLLYRKFYHILKGPLLTLYRQCIKNGRLNASARRGIINLLPRKGKQETLIQSWRPITLLGYDYKILAKLLANRMDEVMSDLIGPQQFGFMKNRSIHQNIRRTMEVILYMKRTEQPGLIVQIDFQKCFDRIEYCAIKGSMEYFNFHPKFIEMAFLLYNDFKVYMQNNGYTSKYIRKTRSVNQGCPLSPGAYLLCSEVMSHILHDKTEGINIHGIHNLLSQFADDTSAYLRYKPLIIQNFCQGLHQVEANTGLKVSYEKTSLYRIGSLFKTQVRCYTTVSFTNKKYML